MSDPLENAPTGCAVAINLFGGGLFALCVLFCMGGFSLFTALSNWLGPRSWVPTPCTVISFDVDTTPADSHNVDSTSSSRVEVRYRYVVGERTYMSTRYAYSSDSADLQIVEPFSPGPATCFVDPSHPESAVLVCGLHLRAAPFLVAGFIALAAVLPAFRRLRKKRVDIGSSAEST